MLKKTSIIELFRIAAERAVAIEYIIAVAHYVGQGYINFMRTKEYSFIMDIALCCEVTMALHISSGLDYRFSLGPKDYFFLHKYSIQT